MRLKAWTFVITLKTEFHYITAIHLFQLNIWDKELSKQAWLRLTTDHLSLSISKVGWDRGGWKGSPSTGAPAPEALLLCPPNPQPRQATASSVTGRTKGGARERNLPAWSVIPHTAASFLLSALPSRWPEYPPTFFPEPQDRPRFYTRSCAWNFRAAYIQPSGRICINLHRHVILLCSLS